MKQSLLERSLPKQENKVLVKQAVCAIILSNFGIVSVTRKHSTLLCLPGGKVDEGETLTQAMVREVHEETGISLDESKFTPVLGKLVLGDDGNDYYTTCFYYTEQVDDPSPFPTGGLPWVIEEGIECKFVKTQRLLDEGIFSEYNEEALVAVGNLILRSM